MRVNHSIFKCFLIVFLVFLIFFLNVEREVIAESKSFVLEAEQHWETFGVGGTCIPGGHNLAVADIDGDGVTEMITAVSRII